jgi:hypothetical protein
MPLGRTTPAGWAAIAASVAVACAFTPYEAATDAGAVEAGPDASDVHGAPCPASYRVIGALRSRYRLTELGPYRAVHDECKRDALGATHLVALDDAAEGAALYAVFGAAAADWWVGGWQQPGQAQPVLGWRASTGEPLVAGLWAIGEPDDADGKEDNRQNAAAYTALGLADYGTLQITRRGVCECDGRRVDPSVEADLPPR